MPRCPKPFFNVINQKDILNDTKYHEDDSNPIEMKNNCQLEPTGTLKNLESIRYTLDGSIPTSRFGELYMTKITVKKPFQILLAVKYRPGYMESELLKIPIRIITDHETFEANPEFADQMIVNPNKIDYDDGSMLDVPTPMSMGFEDEFSPFQMTPDR